jgi:signal transduction histidine kinase
MQPLGPIYGPKPYFGASAREHGYVTSEAALRRATPVALATAALLVLLTGWVGIALTWYSGRVAAIWISNAILLFFILRHPRRDWAAFLAAGCAANLAADMIVGDNLFAGCVFSLCNTIEILLIAIPLRLWKLDSNFTRPHSLLVFYALAAGPAPLVSALLSAVYLHAAATMDFAQTFSRWYAADALGLVILLPSLMTVRFAALKAMFARDQIAVTLLLFGVLLAAIAINFFARDYPFAFLFFPAVMLLTFQRGFAGGALGLLFSALYLMVPAVVGASSGALHTHTVREQLFVVQIFVAVIGFSVVLAGAALEERRRLERGLASAIDHAEMAREEAFVARDAAQKANRAKSMFLANMSHELRTPLNAVIGFAEVMQAEMFGPLGDAHYRDYTGMIQQAGRHLLELISDILDMSKIEAGKLELQREAVDIAAVARDCVELMGERAAQAGLTLIADLEGAPAQVYADRRAMKQILLNLLSNASKFTPAGGHVAVSARMSGCNLILSVTDSGIGIPGDQLYRLGNPFVQIRQDASTTQTGTGLGLALVRALAEMHKGVLRIESVEGNGTTVSVEIPNDEAARLAA